MKNRFMGSTLMELLIILVIVGLLVQVAVPQYRIFVQKAQARERLADLLSLQTQIESCYFQTMDYRQCAEALQEPASGMLEKEAERFSYRLAIVAKDEDVLCSRVETDETHAPINLSCPS
jgi:Tfp pilus assembly protein PilE